MKCSNCGSDMNRKETFCKICGASTNNSQSSSVNMNNKKKNYSNTKVILFIIIAVLMCISLIPISTFVVATIKMKEINNNINQSTTEDTAYSIISSVEFAYTEAFLASNKNNLTLEDIKEKYDGKFSTWNDDNTITSKNKKDKLVCNVIINSNNEMIVECDVNGKKINSEPLSMKININNDGTNSEIPEEQNIISYNIISETIPDGLSVKKLYVNKKLADLEGTNVEVSQLNDILIVEVSNASSTLYAVDKDANIIGVFVPENNNYYKNIQKIVTKANYRDAYRIEGNDLYVTTDKLSQDPNYVVCNMITNDDEAVVYEEKFEYLGNNKFSTSIITKQVTRKQYMQEYNINCGGNNNEAEGGLSIKKTSLDTITFYKNEKEIGKYKCEGVECGTCGSFPNKCYTFVNSSLPINRNGKVALYDTNDKSQVVFDKIVIFDVNNNKVIDFHQDIVDAYNLGNKYIILKNKNNQLAILDKNYEYVKNYSNKQYVYRTGPGYAGHNNFNVGMDMIVAIENNKYGIEKISKNETIVSHKYDDIALTDGITVYSTDGYERDFYYTDTLYKNKYFKGKIGDKWYLYYLNTEEKVINKGYDRLYLIDEKTIAVYQDGEISFIDYNGNSVTDEKIEVNISDYKHFYNSPEGIRFMINDNIVSIYVDIEESAKQHKFELNLETKKITKLTT